MSTAEDERSKGDSEYPDPATTADGQPHPPMSDTLAGICTWAVISLLDFHPNKGAMSPSLVYKIADNTQYQVEVDPREYEDVDDVLAQAKEKLADICTRWNVEAYALAFDSLLDVPGMPALRGRDGSGQSQPSDTPTLFVYAGERGSDDTVLIAQGFSLRRIRGGAETLGVPVIEPGGTSLFSRRRRATAEELFDGYTGGRLIEEDPWAGIDQPDNENKAWSE